jgi:hypothetical protein
MGEIANSPTDRSQEVTKITATCEDRSEGSHRE